MAVSSSRQEGLPVNIMESMYVGLPIIATDCRGNRDLIEDGKNGYVVAQLDSNRLIELIEKIYNKQIDIQELKNISKQKSTEYLLDSIIKLYQKIYNI